MKLGQISAAAIGMGLALCTNVGALTVNPISDTSPGRPVTITATPTHPVVTDLIYEMGPLGDGQCPFGADSRPPTLYRWVPGSSDPLNGGFLFAPRCTGRYVVRVTEPCCGTEVQTVFHSVSHAPIADPGPNQVLPHSPTGVISLVLDASGSFDEDIIDRSNPYDWIVTYHWQIEYSRVGQNNYFPMTEFDTPGPVFNLDLHQVYDYRVMSQFGR